MQFLVALRLRNESYLKLLFSHMSYPAKRAGSSLALGCRARPLSIVLEPHSINSNSQDITMYSSFAN